MVTPRRSVVALVALFALSACSKAANQSGEATIDATAAGQASVQGSNGMVHVIDGVLVP